MVRITSLLLGSSLPAIGLLITDGFSLSLVETMIAIFLIVGFAVVAVASTIQRDV